MQFVAYWRDQAARYRQLAELEDSVLEEPELLDLAALCEEVADSVEDRQPSG
jgi:hypothetical protein